MSWDNWEPVIGLEIHAQLATQSKLFACDSAAYGGGDNEHMSEVTLGLPGSLPVLNRKAVEFACRIGLALNCEINRKSVFARKNYFYPDLPKGYQISQFDEPICRNGFIDLPTQGGARRIPIVRAHLEEDAGKSTHHGHHTLLNFNRAGVPLLEIVSGPDIESPAEAAEYAKMIRNILVYLEVCDGNLEEGSLRCDCNVSVRKKGEKKLGTKVEIKNLNSFRFIEKALEYEIKRQIDTIEIGESIIQETRLYDSTKNRTFSMRGKEDAHDYRYFPDPDLLPITIESEWVESLRKQLPELPAQKAARFQEDYGLAEYESQILVQDKFLATYFEESVKGCGNAKAVSNWILGEVLRLLKESSSEIHQAKVTPKQLADLVRLIDSGQLSIKLGKKIFAEMWQSGKDAEALVAELGVVQIKDESMIEGLVDTILSKNPDQVAQYRDGKEKLFGFFVGQVMRETKGQADPDLVNQILQRKLKGP